MIPNFETRFELRTGYVDTSRKEWGIWDKIGDEWAVCPNTVRDRSATTRAFHYMKVGYELLMFSLQDEPTKPQG